MKCGIMRRESRRTTKRKRTQGDGGGTKNTKREENRLLLFPCSLDAEGRLVFRITDSKILKKLVQISLVEYETRDGIRI